MEFIRSTWTNNNYAKSLSLDFWTGAIAGTFFIILEGYRLKMKRMTEKKPYRRNILSV